MYVCILPLYHCFSLLLFKMPRVLLETRRMIVAISKSGYSVQDIQNRLAEENIYTSKVSIYKILRKYQHHRIITDCFRCSHTARLSSEQLKFINDSMARNDEITERQMHELLHEKWLSLEVSISTFKIVLPGQPLTRYAGRGSGQTRMLHSCLTHQSFGGVLTTG